MLQPFSQYDQTRRVSTGADSLSSSSIITVKPAQSLKGASGRRFVSAPITPHAQSSPELIARESFGYTRETTAQLDALGESELRSMTRWSDSTGSPNASPRLHKRDSSITKRFSLRGPSWNTGIYGENTRVESPSRQSLAARQAAPDEPSPTRTPGVLSRLGSRRVASGTDSLKSPQRPPLVSNASSPSILGLSSRTIDTYRRDPSQVPANLRQPRTLPLFNGGRNAVAAGMTGTLQLCSNMSHSPAPAGRRTTEDTQEPKVNTQVQRSKSGGSKKKKSMLSQALKRANDAVGLDNTQDYAGAVAAYQEACECLIEVMKHSSNNEDREKLQQIRGTYASRIQELQHADGVWSPPGTAPREPLSAIRTPTLDKDLPALPRDSPIRPAQPLRADESNDNMKPDSLRDIWPEEDYDMSFPPQAAENFSFASDATEQDPDSGDDHAQITNAPHTPPARTVPRIGGSLETVHATTGSPAPLVGAGDGSESQLSSINPLLAQHVAHQNPPRSRDSDTEAAFNAALDAAVEAVYDEGYEPYQEGDLDSVADDRISARTFTANPDSTREAAIAAAGAHALVHGHEHAGESFRGENFLGLGLGEDMEEEERLLEEITRDFMLDNHALDEEAKSVLPRQSDSSTSSSAHTWESSAASSVHTSGPTLSPVHEKAGSKLGGPFAYGLPPSGPPPTSALPPPPASALARVLPISTLDSSSVQDRRLSSSKRLQIRTLLDARPTSRGTSTMPLIRSDAQDASFASLASTASDTNTLESSFASGQTRAGTSSSLGRNAAALGSSSLSVPTPALSSTLSDRSGMFTPLFSPTDLLTKPRFVQPLLDRHASNVSTKERSLRTMPADMVESSTNTPSSLGFSAGSTAGGSLLPHSASFGSSLPAPPAGQFDLFTNIHVSVRGQQRQLSLDLPSPLEPCPEATLLRPFWLLRCIYQTIAHPRGGYLSAKLFIPRDVWKVQNVKIKGVEEKIAVCDLVTNALAKLRKADTLDADAVLEDMQYLESVMDQAQAMLSKKLGSDVGSKDLASSFKDAPLSSASFDKSTASFIDNQSSTFSTSTGGSNTTINKPGKSYLSSLGRKLRNKPSHNSLASSFNSTSGSLACTAAASYTLSTVPMTPTTTILTARTLTNRSRTHRTTSTAFLTPPLSTHGSRPLTDGPYVAYTSALARLCDAAQVLDEIVRQAEDPGVKASGPTHVGLELGARHAAEFFGLWICRWVLGDLGMLVDKFGKRAGEYLVA